MEIKYESISHYNFQKVKNKYICHRYNINFKKLVIFIKNQCPNGNKIRKYITLL